VYRKRHRAGRQFSAIRLPDDVLASRTITIPVVRTNDKEKAKRSTADHGSWPCDRRRLLDDLWALGLAGLPALPQRDVEAAARTKLSGRQLEPWRAVLAVAWWLQEEHHVAGLFEEMETLSRKYQDERFELDPGDPVRILIKALRRMLRECGDCASVLEFEPGRLAEVMNTVAAEDGVTDSSAEGPEGEGDSLFAGAAGSPPAKFTSAKKVGRLLRRLRFTKLPKQKAARWQTSSADVEALADSYGVGKEEEQPESEETAAQQAQGTPGDNCRRF
jgi:hypothetical protein